MTIEIEKYIVDIEQTDSGFTVIMDLPGELYDQDYPKRMRHGFPSEKRFFKEKEGVPKWKRHLQETYLETKDKELEKTKLKEKIKKEKEKLKK